MLWRSDSALSLYVWPLEASVSSYLIPAHSSFPSLTNRRLSGVWQPKRAVRGARSPRRIRWAMRDKSDSYQIVVQDILPWMTAATNQQLCIV